MAAVSDADSIEPFGRYRFRGLDPKAVERWASNFERENAELRDQIAALEARVMEADAFAEDAIKEMVSLQEIVKRAETDQAIFVARQQLFRAETAQIVHDAWAEAHVVRAQTEQHIERTQAQLAATKATHARHLEAMRTTMMAEIEAAIAQARATMAAECAERQARITDEYTEHQAQIAALERERMRLVTEIEASTAGVLTRIAPLKHCEPDTDLTNGAQITALSHVTHDVEEALTMFATTMERALSVPAATIEPSQPDAMIGEAVAEEECLQEQAEPDAAG